MARCWIRPALYIRPPKASDMPSQVRSKRLKFFFPSSSVSAPAFATAGCRKLLKLCLEPRHGRFLMRCSITAKYSGSGSSYKPRCRNTYRTAYVFGGPVSLVIIERASSFAICSVVFISRRALDLILIKRFFHHRLYDRAPDHYRFGLLKQIAVATSKRRPFQELPQPLTRETVSSRP